MLKKRIAASLIIKDGIVVQSIGFKRYLPIGKLPIAVEYLNSWGIDEIILLDISATKNSQGPNFKLIREASLKCFVPLTIGGGINNINQIKELMHCGSDKVSLNQIAIHKPELIRKAAEIFGNQSVVVSIDAIKFNSSYLVYDYLHKQPLKISPFEMAKKFEQLGAGEILINSVDRDGSYLGYDINLINKLCKQVDVPVICCGGAKNAKDLVDVLKNTTVSAACAGNFFHFTEHSVSTTKMIISKKIDIRNDNYFNYEQNNFDNECRLLKKDEKELEKLLYTKIYKENI